MRQHLSKRNERCTRWMSWLLLSYRRRSPSILLFIALAIIIFLFVQPSRLLPQAQVTSCFIPRTTEILLQKRLPLPILNVGFPKMGSNTLDEFFYCGGLQSSHFHCGKGRQKNKNPCGTCMARSVAVGEPPLHSCGDFDAYTELNYVSEAPCV